MPLPVMIFILLCFIGLAVIFFFTLRSMEKLHADMRDEHAQLRIMLRAMESRLMHASGEMEPRPASDGTSPQAEPAAPSGPPESLSLKPAGHAEPRRRTPNGLNINFD